MQKIGVFTIASKNYLAYVKVLMESVQRIHPEYARYLCLADKVDGLAEQNFQVVEAETIDIPNFDDMALRYDIMEFNTAVKPFMIQWLFKTTDLDVVIYLDPDIRVFSRFERLEQVMEGGASVVLTPHITKPVEDGLIPNDHQMLQAGVFNLGFVAMRRCPEAIEYAQWWGRRLATMCASDISNALFTDQKWCDLAPCFLNDLVVLKDTAYNVAYWNLFQRRITQDDAGQWLVDGKPLVFFHFSGVNVDKPTTVSKHQNRLKWDDIKGFSGLFEAYFAALISSGWYETKVLSYAYGKTRDGVTIANVLRKFYRSVYQQQNPNANDRAGAHLVALGNKLSEQFDDDSEITALMMFIYQERKDLQEAFNLSTPDGRLGFRNWFNCSAQREYGLGNEFIMLTQTDSTMTAKKKAAELAYKSLIRAENGGKFLVSGIPLSQRQALKSVVNKVKIWILKKM